MCSSNETWNHPSMFTAQPNACAKISFGTRRKGASLARRGGTPLLVDLDAQSHLSSILNPGAASGESLFAYYNVGRPLKEVARPVRFGGELIPAHLELVKVDSMFGKGPDILNKLK